MCSIISKRTKQCAQDITCLEKVEAGPYNLSRYNSGRTIDVDSLFEKSLYAWIEI